MIKRKGNLFDTTATHIGHGVNVDGKMGSGIAVQFRNRFPKMHSAYVYKCSADECLNNLRPGGLFSFEENGKWIHNIASQDRPGANAKYVWLHSGAYKAAQRVVQLGGNILALPMIGCGIGGLEWSHVENILLTIEEELPMQFEVWKFE